MLKERFTATKSWAARHPRRFVVYILSGLAGLLILFQLLYPTVNLVPFSSIEDVELGGSSKTEAIKVLDEKFNSSDIAVHFNDSETAFFKAGPSEVGIASSNKGRIEAINYPFFLRLVPTSILWAHTFVNAVDDLEYQRNQDTLDAFLATKFGEGCHLDVINATVNVEGENIQAVEAFSGGDCDLNEVRSKLTSVTPTTEGAKVTISGNEIKPTVTTKRAEELAEHVKEVIKDGIAVNDGKDKHTIPKEILRTWLDFAITDNKLDYSFNAERSASYLGERIASRVEKPTGVSTVTLRNFAEVSRDAGQSGVVFNQPAMLTSIKTALEKGENTVAVEVTTIEPTVKYVRTYNPDDPALSALLKKYAESHPGTYGVSMRELSGARRNASYRASTQYTTASTYKMFVAYSTLLRVESGEWKWSDRISGGRDLTQCFNDMIQLSDNECAVALLKKISVKTLTDEAHAIGATQTSFLVPNSIKSTAEDESLLLGLLESGQLLSQQSSRDTWIAAMKKNVYRQGIPKGVPSAVVADKVGFLDAWLHDASIVYSPKGTYVLVILTENASWANIAELAGQIETLRTK
jgi:beta-lactamase class A